MKLGAIVKAQRIERNLIREGNARLAELERKWKREDMKKP